MFKYASDFVTVLRSKTPKIVFTSSDFRCVMMENEPFPNYELFFNNGTRVQHKIGSQIVDVFTVDGNQVRVKQYEDYDFLNPELSQIVDTFFAAVKKCIEVEKLSKYSKMIIKYPICFSPETNLSHLLPSNQLYSPCTLR
eukprot:TRINITY_DN37973_c0_g1_i2.p1 TRINITY_DN37973_c0_g1~~TRINITY_DN37973_c0_g1_i2.p1  ORF type:complete len:140 (+),score=9.91 TRINITY_DN37973_c0_g1_i2:1-420(+)